MTDLPADVRVLETPTWIFWIWPGRTNAAERHLVYVTATTDTILQVIAIVKDMVLGGTITPLAIRFARQPENVDRLNAMPEWCGKAVSVYVASADIATATAQRLDAVLTNRGLSGPAALRARPFGGRSGMVFLRAPALPPSTDARRSRLAALLDANG